MPFDFFDFAFLRFLSSIVLFIAFCCFEGKSNDDELHMMKIKIRKKYLKIYGISGGAASKYRFFLSKSEKIDQIC